MEDEPSTSSAPAWLDPSNDRKTPYSDAELDRLTDDQIAMLADTLSSPMSVASEPERL